MADRQDRRWPCTQCGASLRFAPGQASLTCENCGHVQAIAEAAPRVRAKALGELDLTRGLRDDLPDAATAQITSTTCTSCGAVVDFTGTTYATECPFCASPLAVDGSAHRTIKPLALIAFALTENQARDALTTWLGRLWFAPSKLLEYTRKGRAMTGIYVPYWTFDADSRSRYRGQRGVHYYETRTVTVTDNGKREQRQEQVQKTRWYPAAGAVARDFDDVVTIASTSLPTRLANGLEPWDLTALTAFTPDFLAGFQAEGYTVALADGHSTARARMAQVIDSDVRRDIGGDVQQIDRIDSDFSDETFKHVLLPVWMAAYKYGGKSYRFLVNGQTGEVQGERPYSAWKIAFAVVVVAALVAGAVYLSQMQS